jgi:hypothetical protein
VLASLIGFVALVKEDWLRAKHRWAFQTVLGVSGVVFAGFVAFAIMHAHNQFVITEKLDNFRSDGLLLEEAVRKGMNAFEYSDWQKHIDEWSETTGSYLKENVSDVTKNRFLNTIGRLGLSWGTDQELNNHLNTVIGRGKNLQEIIDGRSHH